MAEQNEFLAVVKHADEQPLARVAEKYRYLVGTSTLSRHGQTIRVSLSTGLAAASTDDTPLSLLAKADKGLYRYKGLDPLGRVRRGGEASRASALRNASAT